MLAWPIAMATSAAIDSIKNIPTDEKCNSSSNYNQDFSIDEIIPLSRLTDKEYEYIKQNYRNKISTNEGIESIIADTNKKLKRINTLSSLIGFITPIRNILSKKAHTLEDKIKKLTLKKEIAVVNLREIIHQYEHNRITLPKNNNVYLVFSPVYNNYYAENMYVIERNHKVFFEFDIPSILTLNFKTFQIIFYDSVLIVTTKNDFAIINYSHISADIQQIHLLEKQLDSNINYGEVKETWLHTCLNGTPDLRYRNNPKVYNVQYWNLSIKLHNLFDISILFSAENIAQEVYSLVGKINLQSVENIKVNSNIYKIDNVHDDIIADLTDTQKELCNILKQIGFQQSKYVTQKRPQFGSYVRRRRDRSVLCVIGVSPQQKFTCFDFVTQKCYIYIIKSNCCWIKLL